MLTVAYVIIFVCAVYGVYDVVMTVRSHTPAKDEHTLSSHMYPNGWVLKSVKEQAKLLSRRFPGLDISHVSELQAQYEKNGVLVLPEGMDGLAVIPKYSVIAKRDKDRPGWPAYNRAFGHLLGMMQKFRKEFVQYADSIAPEHLRLSRQSEAFYKSNEQVPGDVLVVAIQTGLLHRGRSFRCAALHYRAEEFELDAFAVGCILLTHPDRLQHADNLWIDCPGTRTHFVPTNQSLLELLTQPGTSPFSHICGWGFEGGQLRYVSYKIRPNFFHSSSGVATAMLPV